MNIQIEPVKNGFVVTHTHKGPTSGSDLGYSGEKKNRYVFRGLFETLEHIKSLLMPKEKDETA